MDLILVKKKKRWEIADLILVLKNMQKNCRSSSITTIPSSILLAFSLFPHHFLLRKSLLQASKLYFYHSFEYFFRSLSFWASLKNPFLKPIFKPSSLHLHGISSWTTLLSYIQWDEVSSIHRMEWWRGNPSRPKHPCSTLIQERFQGELIFFFWCCCCW